MSVVSRLLDRLLPAVLTAGGVTLVVAGLLSYTTPATAGIDPSGSPTHSATPFETPSPSPSLTTSAAPSVLPSFTPSPSPTASPSPSGEPAVATRIVIAYSGIDLPVMSGEYDPPGNPGNYPLCNVAQYLTVYRQPAEEGTTYIYAHARQGMFLPLLTASQRNDGAELIGRLVQVYTDDNKVYLYEIFAVRRHIRDFAIANNVPPGEHRLVMQTREGPSADYPKLQVAARLLNVQSADPEDAHPVPRPVICG